MVGVELLCGADFPDTYGPAAAATIGPPMTMTMVSDGLPMGFN